ncbi:amidase [Sodalis sp. RH22]|uniref:amidase n=1 Tax=unclassified Sodalis (in: enterobacteria) TaxID=2636512 RepID=UPI0039B6D770
MKKSEMALSQAAERLNVGTVSARELTEAALAAMDDPRGEGVRVFTRIYRRQARLRAAASDERRRAGRLLSSLDGMPISIKDLFDVAGESTTGGSVVLADAPVAARHAVIVDKLLRAGAVIVGKTNMTEFAYSGLGINPHYGTPANPYDRATRRIPGGSSSGGAVAVSDGMCLGSIGSDTGGSVRIPAAFCGLTGYKPTARRIDLAGVLPLSPALDSVGVMAHDVSSCLALDNIISDRPLALVHKPLAQAHFAVPQTLVLDDLDDDVAAAFSAALAHLRRAGAHITEIPCVEFAELSRINAAGGFTALESWLWHRPLIEQNSAQYDPRVISRIRRGEALDENDRRQLLRQRADWQHRVAAAIGSYDALLMPTVPLIAPPIAALDADENAYFRVNGAVLRNPAMINFLDGCAVSLPCQPVDAAPVGLMVASLPMRDGALLNWALQIERCLSAARFPAGK